MDLYESMMVSLGEANDENPCGPVTVEIAERECITENAIILRVAFQETGMSQIEFRNREQLKTLTRALIKYLGPQSVFPEMMR